MSDNRPILTTRQGQSLRSVGLLDDTKLWPVDKFPLLLGAHGPGSQLPVYAPGCTYTGGKLEEAAPARPQGRGKEMTWRTRQIQA